MFVFEEEGHRRLGCGAQADTGKTKSERLAEAEICRVCTKVKSLDFVSRAMRSHWKS